jgi:AcrR family transcriptional regulator
MTTPARLGRGRPRLEQTNQRIMQAALELLREAGPTAVNIEAVADRSGVARTTIYRRYRSRTELMAAVLDELVEAPLPAPELTVAEKLRWVLERVSDVLDQGLGRGGIAAVLADTDPEFTSALRAQLADRLRPLTEMMTADVEAGRLSPHVDPDTLVGLLFGAYLAEVLRHGSPRTGWMARTADLLAPAITGPLPGTVRR